MQPDEHAKVVRFLYEQRITLLNERRAHEWKVFFGAITLMIALDAGLVAHKISVTCRFLVLWELIILCLVVAPIWYEVGLQLRNSLDRIAMNRLYNKLCDLASITDGEIQEKEYTKWGGLWATIPKIIVLLALSAASALLPIAIDVARRGS
jgi:hypothetical protein